MKASYPVILTPAGRGYVVFVPNLNINTEGGTLAEALDMARDAISIWGITEQGPEARNNFRRQGFFSLPQKMAVKNLPGVKKAACPL